MASQIDICNWALDMIGSRAISSLDDDFERAGRLKSAWPLVRDANLRSRSWRFSIKRDSLAADVATPVWGFALQYTIAGDVVRILQIGASYPTPSLSDYVTSDTAVWRIENNKILTDLTAPLKVRWIVNSIDVGIWDACFAKVMACDLAITVGPRLTESLSWKDAVQRDRREAVRDARIANAIEDPPSEPADGSWIAARFAV